MGTDQLEKYIEDKTFMKWVFQPDEEIEQFYQEYMVDYPEEKSRLLELRSELKQLKFSNIEYDKELPDQIYRKFLGDVVELEKRKKWQNRFVNMMKYAAAAVVLVLLGGALSYLFVDSTSDVPTSDIRKFVAEKGSLAHFELNDGTTVWLNSGTEILMSQDSKGIKYIDLKGEAYFDVKGSTSNGLIVNVGDLKIKDIGTSFNVKAYPDDDIIETTLNEGQVDILRRNNNTITSLKPGENAAYNKQSKSLNIRHVELELITSWVDGKFAFREKRLEDICLELERWYDVKFTFNNKQVKDFRYSGVIARTTTVAYVMKMLKITTNINYEIKNNPNDLDEIIIN